MVISLSQILFYFLIVARFTGVLLMAPFFNRKEFISLSRFMIIFWGSALLLFVVPLPVQVPHGFIPIVLVLLSEFLVGVLIGFTADLFITAIEFAGGLMDTQAGLSVAQLLDPSTGRSVTLFSLMLKWISIVIFLQIDGHHMVLAALNQSFNLLPVGSSPNFPAGVQYIVLLATQVFQIAIQLSAPILLVVFLLDFSFGMLSRIAPQVNVFQLGFQLKPSVSLIVFLAVVPAVVGNVYGLMENISDHLLRVLFLLQTNG